MYVPSGYSLSNRAEGLSAGGFWGDANQSALTFRRKGDPLVQLPLTVHLGSRGRAVLLGTEKRRGRPIEIGDSGVTAVYHDGLWQLGAGPEEQQAGSVVVHWDSTDMHSVTVYDRGTTFAVRGARSRGIDIEELLKVAESRLRES